MRVHFTVLFAAVLVSGPAVAAPPVDTTAMEIRYLEAALGPGLQMLGV